MFVNGKYNHKYQGSELKSFCVDALWITSTLNCQCEAERADSQHLTTDQIMYSSSPSPS